MTLLASRLLSVFVSNLFSSPVACKNRIYKQVLHNFIRKYKQRESESYWRNFKKLNGFDFFEPEHDRLFDEAGRVYTVLNIVSL